MTSVAPSFRWYASERSSTRAIWSRASWNKLAELEQAEVHDASLIAQAVQ